MAVGPQDDGGRDPQRGARTGAGKKPMLLSSPLPREISREDHFGDAGGARSNVIERRHGKRQQRGPQENPGDIELSGGIRRLVDVRPTYGYRRIAALLKRERRSDGLA